MTTNLLSVIEQLVGALEALHYDIGTINQQHGLSEAALTAGKQALEQPQGEAIAWEATTPGYIKYVTDEQYRSYSETAKRWYKPYKCSSCHPQATEPAPIGFNGLTQAETEATMSVRGLSEPAPSTAGERAATLERFERLAHRKGELWERCQGKGWPDAESGEFTGLRDEKLPALRAALLSAPALPAAAMQLADDFAAAAVNHYSVGESDKALWQKMVDARQALETKLMGAK